MDQIFLILAKYIKEVCGQDIKRLPFNEELRNAVVKLQYCYKDSAQDLSLMLSSSSWLDVNSTYHTFEVSKLSAQLTRVVVVVVQAICICPESGFEHYGAQYK